MVDGLTISWMMAGPCLFRAWLSAPAKNIGVTTSSAQVIGSIAVGRTVPTFSGTMLQITLMGVRFLSGFRHAVRQLAGKSHHEDLGLSKKE